MRELIGLDNEILTSPAADVDFERHDVDAIASELIEVLNAHGGYGLAAPQIGIPLRMFVLQNNLMGGGLFINPELTWHGVDASIKMEGCLSLPEYSFPIVRWEQIRIRYVDLSSAETQDRKMWGMPARAAQHELDHLDGILINTGPKLRRLESDTENTPVRMVRK